MCMISLHVLSHCLYVYNMTACIISLSVCVYDMTACIISLSVCVHDITAYVVLLSVCVFDMTASIVLLPVLRLGKLERGDQLLNVNNESLVGITNTA